jgi:hypothetical protein
MAEYVVYRAKRGKGHFVDARFPTMAQARSYRAQLLRQWKASGRREYAGYKIRMKKEMNNPAKLKRLTKSTGWMSAKRVKIVKRGKNIGLLIEKPRKRSATRKSKKKKRS